MSDIDVDEIELDSIESTEPELDEIFEDDSAESTDPEEQRLAGLRLADYTKKSQENARIRKELEAEKARLANDQALLLEAVKLLKMQTAKPSEEEWRDPAEVKAELATKTANDAIAMLKAQKLHTDMERALAAHDVLKDLSPEDLFDFMRDNDIGKPAAAAKLMAIEAKEQARKLQNAATTNAKRTTAVVPGTASRRAAESSRVGPQSFDDSFEQALAALGLTKDSPLSL